MKRYAPLALLCVLALACSSAYADTYALVTSLAGLGANDWATWGQIGADGTVFAFGTPATTNGGNSIFADPFNGTALVAVQCPASPSCSWTGGFSAGESLLWTYDLNNGPSAPLGFRVGAATAAGAWIQSDVPAQFTVTLNVYDTALFLATSFSLTSDVAGDPLFVGVIDQTTNGVGAVTFDIGDHDLAAGTLYLQYPSGTVPEPGTISLLAGALVGAGFQLRRRFL